MSKMLLCRILNFPLFEWKEIMFASVFDNRLEYSDNVPYGLFPKSRRAFPYNKLLYVRL